MLTSMRLWACRVCTTDKTTLTAFGLNGNSVDFLYALSLGLLSADIKL